MRNYQLERAHMLGQKPCGIAYGGPGQETRISYGRLSNHQVQTVNQLPWWIPDQEQWICNQRRTTNRRKWTHYQQSQDPEIGDYYSTSPDNRRGPNRR